MKFKSAFASLCLLTLSSTASASLIGTGNDITGIDTVTSTNGTTINWSGMCSDCLGVKGDDSFTNPTAVTGNIVLDGFVGEDFNITSSNFLSFQYNGPSNHVDNLIIHNASYSLLDSWLDNSDIIGGFVGLPFYFATITGNELPENSYLEFAENMDVNGWIAGDLSSYWLDLSFDTYVPINQQTGEYIKTSSLINTGEQALYQLINFDISYQSNGDWSIKANDVLFDIGNNAQASFAEVPEPSSLAIFAAGLLGLLRLRKKA